MSEDKKDFPLSGAELEKPAQASDRVEFPFPDPIDADFDEDISEDEREFYKSKFKDLNSVTSLKLHCTACDRHLGCSAKNESRMHSHPMLRTLVCRTCHTFYNSGEFDKGDDGSELYCRWCGQGGQVYCCADCPHVFCAKCIRRNLGNGKIKEIENTDDWKCFKCNYKCLWDLRAMCWAILRYVDLKNKITYKTDDPKLKELYQKDCAVDYTECCKTKTARGRAKVESKKKEKPIKEEKEVKPNVNLFTKIPPSIQVKKFASIYMQDSSTPKEKKAQKRPASPKMKPVTFNSPINIAPAPRLLNPLSTPMVKKLRLPNQITPITHVRFPDKRPISTYRPRSKPPTIIYPPPSNNMFNGIGNMFHMTNVNSMNNNMSMPMSSDNINLSLENLTQGLDMNAMAAMSSNISQDDDVVCTPDFPIEPLCEVTEENPDDDVVECVTPAPTPQPVTNSVTRKLPELCPENIIQMTENDVTVNTVTGGLKFRVDPQTLSANKMYRLPDGRIFAINPNPNMPGGYSATIVAVTEASGKKLQTKGTTFAAKLSTIPSGSLQAVPPLKKINKQGRKNNVIRNSKEQPAPKQRDLQTPVEWFRFNLIDAVDCLDYSLNRLHKLKKDTSKPDFLRTRSVNQMKELHRTLDRLLNTSITRFSEIKGELNKSFKNYLTMKDSTNSDDDDDVEILPNTEEGPIFIDENSCESVTSNHEVDLTGVGSSDLNDSAEKLSDTECSIIKNPSKVDDLSVNDTNNKNEMDSSNNTKTDKERENNIESEIHNEKSNDAVKEDLMTDDKDSDIENASTDGDKISHRHENNEEANDNCDNDKKYENNKTKDMIKKLNDSETINIKDPKINNSSDIEMSEVNNSDADIDDKVVEKHHSKQNDDIDKTVNKSNGELNAEDTNDEMITGDIPAADKTNEADDNKSLDDNEKTDIRDEMSDEMIESLLKDDGITDDANMQSVNSFDISEVV